MNDQLFFLGEEGNRDVHLYYEISSNELGKGSYGTVQTGRLKGTKINRAIKIIDKSKVSNVERFKLEVEIMFRLNHPSIIRLFDYFEDNKSIYLVLELCSGGELFDRIIENEFYNEDDARLIFKQIIKAIHYCHLNGVCHRDLKPENFIMLSRNNPSLLKVIDFGLSKTFPNTTNNANQSNSIPAYQHGPKSPNELDINQPSKSRRQTKAVLKTKAGTPFYIAPEVLSGHYTEKCDVWSCGVILYILFCGYPPFYGENNKEILESVKLGKLEFSTPEWKDKSKISIDLIKKMVVNQDTRLFSDEVIKHPWMQSKNYKIDDKKYKEIVANMTRFSKLPRLKKLIFYFIAHNLYEEDLIHLHEYFYLFDPKDQGSIGLSGFKEVVNERSHMIEKDAEILFDGLDIFESKTIGYSQFIACALSLDTFLTENKLAIFFQICDIERSEKLSLLNFEKFLAIQLKYRVDMTKKFKFSVMSEFSTSKMLNTGFEKFKQAFVSDL